MSKTLMPMLLPFLSFQFKFGDGDVAAEPQATEENVAPAEESAPETAPEEQKPESKTFTQEDVDKIVQKTKSKLERKYERERLAQQVREQPQQQRQPAQDDPLPKESDFETYGEYLRAVAQHEAREIIRAERKAAEEEKIRGSQQAEEGRRAQLEQQVMEAGEDKYDDFEEVVAKTGDLLKAKNLSFSRAMLNALLEADNAADIIYHLGQKLDEAERIARLPAFAQAKEIGKLEDKLQAKPQKQISKAPEPIKPVGSGKASSDTDLSDDLPIEEWMARRNKQARGR